MALRSLTPVVATALALSFLVPATASAQLGRLIRRAAADESKRQIEALVRDGVRCVFNDLACVEKAKADGKTPVMTDNDGNLITDGDGRPVTDPATAAKKMGPAQKPGTGAWANYDFVPGDRVLFFDDYSADRVGDFPRRFELTAGNWEVVEWQGRRFLRATSGGTISVPLPETLPEQFTIEFPASVQHGNAYVRLSTASVYQGTRDYAGSMPSLEYTQAGLRPQKNVGPRISTPRRQNARGDALVTFRVMADGDYMKMYLNDHRVANAPNAVFPRTKTIYISVSSATEDLPIMIGPMRIAAGGLDLYDRLERDGRVATQGILFASDSDIIRPESTPTLKEIAGMLQAHPDLSLSIEGHTDSDGDDAYNLDLSRRRAAAVKAYLVESERIDAGRLQTAGFGETKPVADNGTPEGKQQNRRVELVKQGG
ncbi:MAG: OmpA family protein [Vicinamibacterales bacterium]